jgi:hypothetical protein
VPPASGPVPASKNGAGAAAKTKQGARTAPPATKTQ